MFSLRSPLLQNLTTVLSFQYRTPRKVESFNHRIRRYNNILHKYDRQFHMRPPNLATKNNVTFPLTVPFRLRHRYIPVSKRQQFVDNTAVIHWNRLTPNEILLGFENIQFLDYNEMMEGLRFLAEIKGQEEHNWNQHPWVSQALDQVNKQFIRIKRKDYLNVYYLMKKLRYENQDFWKKMYALIEERLYDLYPSEFQKFFLRYYKVSDQYFSPQMKDKFLTLLEGRLRAFSPQNIIKIYQIYQEEDRIDEFWLHNVFVPLFKSQQYTYKPKDLQKIFRFMLIQGHEKDDRLYDALYKRLTQYEELTEEEIDLLEEVIHEVKDLFISHRVDPYIAHLKEMRTKMKELNAGKKKQIPIHELVRRDLIFYTHKRKQNLQNASQVSQQSTVNKVQSTETPSTTVSQ